MYARKHSTSSHAGCEPTPTLAPSRSDNLLRLCVRACCDAGVVGDSLTSTRLPLTDCFIAADSAADSLRSLYTRRNSSPGACSIALAS